MTEKCTAQLPPVRCEDELAEAIKDLAYAADRSPSDYIRWVLRLHVYGHGATLTQSRSDPPNGRA